MNKIKVIQERDWEIGDWLSFGTKLTIFIDDDCVMIAHLKIDKLKLVAHIESVGTQHTNYYGKNIIQKLIEFIRYYISEEIDYKNLSKIEKINDKKITITCCPTSSSFGYWEKNGFKKIDWGDGKVIQRNNLFWLIDTIEDPSLSYKKEIDVLDSEYCSDIKYKGNTEYKKYLLDKIEIIDNRFETYNYNGKDEKLQEFIREGSDEE